MEQSTQNTIQTSVPKEEHEILIQEENFWKPGKISLLELLGIIGNIFTVLTFCTIDRITAKYRHQEGLYNISKTVAAIMAIILTFEILYLLYRYVENIRNFCQKTIEIIKEVEKRSSHSNLRNKIPNPKVIIPVFCSTLIIVLFFILFNWHHTVYCTAVSEIYGIPQKLGESLKKSDLKEHAFYWQIKDYPLQNKVILTYMEQYDQIELMEKYSTAYNMTLFKPYAKIEYRYTNDEDEFFSYDQESYFRAAGGNNFRSLKEVSYYGSNGKLLMKMERSGSDKFEVSSYSVEDRPQLFQSTLFRVPEPDNESIDSQLIEIDMTSQQIEVIYNSAGLPQIRKLSGGHINLYGVNGERYEYDRKKRLTALYYLDAKGSAVCNKLGIMQINFEYDNDGNLESICYFSDEKGIERTEGFYGVFCEAFEYEEGNLKERRQLDRRGNCCYDTNGIYMYQYTYDRESLVQENYLGTDKKPVQDNLFYSNTIKFIKQNSKKLSVILESSWTQKPEIINLIEGEEEAFLFSEYPEIATSAKPQQFNKLLPPNLAILNNNTDSARNYTSIQYIINKNNCIEEISYRDENDRPINNELGYSILRLKYDQNMQIIEKEFKDPTGKTSLTKDGYAILRNTYDPEQIGVILTQTYLGENRVPTFNQQLGCAYVSYHRDSLGRSKRLTVSYYDINGSLVHRLNRAYSIVKQTYDENGYLTKESYYDESNSAVCRSDYGVAEILYEYWESGNIMYEKYNDVYGHPANRSDSGYAAIYQKYENGHLRTKKYEGYQGQTLINVTDATTGISMIQYTYDNGNLKKEKYFDIAQNPVLRKDTGFCMLEYEYNEFGRCRSEKYYDTNEQPVISSKYHCAGIEYTYPEEGMGKEIGYLGLDGRLMDRPDLGYAKTCIKYFEEENGDSKDNMPVRKITISYINKNERSTVQKDGGYAICEIRYIRDNSAAGSYGVECSYYDESHRLILCNDTGYATVQYNYDYGKCVSVCYYGTTGDLIVSSKYRCAGKYFIYDEKGHPVDIQYIDIDNSLMVHPDLGYSVVHFDYDKSGNKIRESYFDESMNPAIWKEGGFSIRDFSYEDGRCVETRYCLIDDKLVPQKNWGCAIVKYTYDQSGRCISEYYYDAKKEPAISSIYHYAGKIFVYNERGNLKKIQYTGIDGKLMTSPDLGYSIVQYQYDSQERCIAEFYFDTQERPVIHSEYRCAGKKYSYNEYGHLSDTWFIGLNRNVMIRPDLGIAQIHYEYDENGNIISELYYDIDGKAVINSKYQCAGLQYRYDDHGNRTDILYIGTDEKIINCPALGFAHIHSEYDNYRNLIREAYYDVNDNPTVCLGKGYASCVYAYESGNLTRISYYDDEGALTARQDYGYAQIEYKYDDMEQLIFIRYYGADKNLATNTEYHCAGFGYQYDERGNEISIWYIGLNGEKIIRNDLGYAEVHKEYDDYGNLVGEYYYDVSGNPTISKDGGFHAYNNQYANGNLTETSYYDKKGDLTLLPDYGYAIEENMYDECGQIIRIQYYGIEGEPVINSKYQCSGFLYNYNSRGNRTDILYTGINGEFIEHPDFGVAHIRSEYDEYGNKIREEYYNAYGEPVIRKDTEYARAEYLYDAYGECIGITYFDLCGELITD